MAGDVDQIVWKPVLRRIISRPLLGGDRCTLYQRQIAVFYQSEVSYAWNISKPEIILHFRNSGENRYKLWAKWFLGLFAWTSVNYDHWSWYVRQPSARVDPWGIATYRDYWPYVHDCSHWVSLSRQHAVVGGISDSVHTIFTDPGALISCNKGLN